MTGLSPFTLLGTHRLEYTTNLGKVNMHTYKVCHHLLRMEVIVFNQRHGNSIDETQYITFVCSREDISFWIWILTDRPNNCIRDILTGSMPFLRVVNKSPSPTIANLATWVRRFLTSANIANVTECKDPAITSGWNCISLRILLIPSVLWDLTKKCTSYIY